MSELGALERFAMRSRRARRAREGAVCELCAAPIGEPHRHIVDRTDRRLLCACAACAFLFPDDSASRYRAVPTRPRHDPSWTLTEEELTRLGVPVGLVFFFRAETLSRWVAVFPSPAGATEADLPDHSWDPIVESSPLVRTMKADVEGLLVHRKRSGETFTLVAPIDACYALTAVLRTKWKGIDGGDDVRVAVDEFLGRLAAAAVAS